MTEKMTLWGTLTDGDGAAMWHTRSWQGDWRGGRWVGDIDVSAQPSRNFLRMQAPRIPVDVNHDPARTVGECVYLELSTHSPYQLRCVTVVDGQLDLDEVGPLYFSAYTDGKRRYDEVKHRDIRLRSVAVCRRPAGIGVTALEGLPGDLRDYGDRSRWGTTPKLTVRAIAWLRDYKRGDRIEIVDDTWQRRAEPAYTRSADPYPDCEPTGPIRYSGAHGRVLSVREVALASAAGDPPRRSDTAADPGCSGRRDGPHGPQVTGTFSAPPLDTRTKMPPSVCGRRRRWFLGGRRGAGLVLELSPGIGSFGEPQVVQSPPGGISAGLWLAANRAPYWSPGPGIRSSCPLGS
jgi:hypothetical protein